MLVVLGSTSITCICSLPATDLSVVERLCLGKPKISKFLVSSALIQSTNVHSSASSLELITQHFTHPQKLGPQIGTSPNRNTKFNILKFEDIQCIPGWIQYLYDVHDVAISPLEGELLRPTGDQKDKCVFHGPRHGDVEKFTFYITYHSNNPTVYMHKCS